MKHIFAALLVPFLLCQANPTEATEFDKIQPSANLSWTPCYNGAACAKLQVPLDYANTNLGTVAIAFIKLAGKNATAESPSIVVIPGGPGGSGIDILLQQGSEAAYLFGDQYNIISFDPRGVNNSGPYMDCFSGNTKARTTFSLQYQTGATTPSSPSLVEQYSTGANYGHACNNAAKHGSPDGYYVTTTAVVRDLVSYIEAEARMLGRDPAEAKLWSYGISYGTAVGQTFATMFPDRVERMVLDGTINTDQYYQNDWSDNTLQMDAAVDKFAILCHAAGKDKCDFWQPTAEDILGKLDAIIRRFQEGPVAVENCTDNAPKVATYADLKSLLLNAVYQPPTQFPVAATALHQIDSGNASAIVGLFDPVSALAVDAGFITRCVDSYRRNSVATLSGWRRFVEVANTRSKYLGDIWPSNAESALCRAMSPDLPDSMMAPASLGARTPFPILFASNTIDPATPFSSARKMMPKFPGSVLLMQDAVGHTVVNQMGSECFFGHVQAYFAGVVPPANTTCAPQNVPFLSGFPQQ